MNRKQYIARLNERKREALNLLKKNKLPIMHKIYLENELRDIVKLIEIVKEDKNIDY